MGSHRDLCEIKWSAGELVLLERIAADDPRGAGDYIYISPPHPDDACPFNTAERVRWTYFEGRLMTDRKTIRVRRKAGALPYWEWSIDGWHGGYCFTRWGARLAAKRYLRARQ